MCRFRRLSLLGEKLPWPKPRVDGVRHPPACRNAYGRALLCQVHFYVNLKLYRRDSEFKTICRELRGFCQKCGQLRHEPEIRELLRATHDTGNKGSYPWTVLRKKSKHFFFKFNYHILDFFLEKPTNEIHWTFWHVLVHTFVHIS